MFLKRVELTVLVFRICAEIWASFEETRRIMDSIFKECGTNCQEEQRICKCSSVILLRFEVISLHCRNIGIVFIDFAELWVADMCGIMGPKFKQKWHVLFPNEA